LFDHLPFLIDFFIFKLEEEGNTALLLLLLPKLFAGGRVFASAAGLRCRLVVETLQAAQATAIWIGNWALQAVKGDFANRRIRLIKNG
jgi:hypothetical protein